MAGNSATREVMVSESLVHSKAEIDSVDSKSSAETLT